MNVLTTIARFGRRTQQTITDDAWIVSYQEGINSIENRNGVIWYDAPIPKRRHACTAQTRGYMSGRFHRCACGAITFGDGYWMDRNSRKPTRD